MMNTVTTKPYFIQTGQITKRKKREKELCLKRPAANRPNIFFSYYLYQHLQWFFFKRNKYFTDVALPVHLKLPSQQNKTGKKPIYMDNKYAIGTSCSKSTYPTVKSLSTRIEE